MIRRRRRWKINESKRNVGSIKCKPNICKLNVNIMNDNSENDAVTFVIIHAHTDPTLWFDIRQPWIFGCEVCENFELIYSKLILSFNNISKRSLSLWMSWKVSHLCADTSKNRKWGECNGQTCFTIPQGVVRLEKKVVERKFFWSGSSEM